MKLKLLGVGKFSCVFAIVLAKIKKYVFPFELHSSIGIVFLFYPIANPTSENIKTNSHFETDSRRSPPVCVDNRVRPEGVIDDVFSVPQRLV